jgi:hypothetical protein
VDGDAIIDSNFLHPDLETQCVHEMRHLGSVLVIRENIVSPAKSSGILLA